MKYLLITAIGICIYGFLPVSFAFNPMDIKKPNNLLVSQQDCGCPCANAIIINGRISIPVYIINKYPNISQKEINLTGEDPFNTSDFDLSHQAIIITGKVIGVDTISCDPTNYEVVLKFEVDKWATSIYYPRLWTHGKLFMIMFLLSNLYIIMTFLFFIVWTVQKLLHKSGG